MKFQPINRIIRICLLLALLALSAYSYSKNKLNINLSTPKVLAACENTECSQGEESIWACGTGGCAANQRRHCPCQPPGTVGFYWCWGGCYCADDPSCAAGGTTCAANTTECSGTCGTGCRQCLGDGSGWTCQDASVCGGCGGGGSCTPTTPTAFSLLAPPNLSHYLGNDVYFDWQNVGSWGTGCPQNNRYRLKYMIKDQAACRAQDSSLYTQTSVSTTASNMQINNMQWGTTYCWFAFANNGSVVKNSRETWEFTTTKTATLASSGISSTSTCGNNISGSPSIAGTDNPITFYTEYSLNDNGVGVEGIKQAAVAIVPNDYASANIVSESVLMDTSKDYFMALAQIDSTNPEQSQFSIVNKNGASGDYSNTQSSGNLTNSASTATLMNINDMANVNSTHVQIINANRVRVYWQIKFEDNYKYTDTGALFAKIIDNNIYAAAFREYLPGQWNSSTGSSTIARSLGLTSVTWGVNVQLPSAQIGDPTIINATDFSILWDVVAYGKTKVEGYMWTQNQPVNVNKVSPSPTGIITLPVTEPNTDTRPVPNSNINAYFRTGFTSKLGTHRYSIQSTDNLTDIINTKMYAEDSACNYIVDSGNSLNLTGRWLMTAYGSSYAQNFNFTVKQSNILPSESFGDYSYLNAFSYLSTYLTSALQKPITSSSRQSKASFILDGYNDWNGLVPKTASANNWYDYLFKVVGSNTTIKTSSATVLASSGKTSTILAPLDPNNTVAVLINSNFTIQADALCDTKTIFFVNGNLSITPDFKVKNPTTTNNGCAFIVNGNINIQNGSAKDYYDRIDAFMITSNSFNTFEDKTASSPVQYDGLYIKGGVFAQTTSLERTFQLLKNLSYPAEIIEYDPRYSVLLSSYLKIQEYSIREKDFIKKVSE